ncbi:MAG: sensor domain-containing diguanylate cyclase [Candidatus Kapaibacteriota bacterium]
MTRRKVDFRKVFLPGDSIAFVVIIIGLFIAVFLGEGEMAVRLIGICIAILGGVALFMMVSPRMSDPSVMRQPRPTDSPSLMSETRKDPLKTSQVFDSIAYRATFGAEETSGEPIADERQMGLFPEMLEEQERKQLAMEARAAQQSVDLEFSDSTSSVRIVGTKRARSLSAGEPALAITSREARRAAEIRAEVEAEPSITEEVQLSEDVTIRPKSASSSTSASATSQTTSPAASTSPVVSAPTSPSAAPAPEPADPNSTDDEESKPAPAPATHKRRKSEISVQAFMADANEEMESSEEPRKEFDYLLNRVLMVIRAATLARTAAFFWFNREKQQLVLEARITDVEENFSSKRKFPIGHDVISQIALEGRPEILSQISPAAELELLPYYAYKSFTSSFVGVPVYFKGNVVGVLCADAREEDAYTDITVGFFGHFTKLISGLVASYTTKYDLQQAARTLDALRMLKANIDDGDDTEHSVIDAVFETVVQLFEVTTIGACMYDRKARAWVLADTRSVHPDYAKNIGTTVDLDTALIGECVKAGEVITVYDPDMIRVLDNEHPLPNGQFLCIPLRSAKRTYGALFIEQDFGTLSQQDIALCEQLGDLAGDALERIRAVERGTRGAHIEATSALLNRDGVLRRLREELARAVDYQTSVTLCLITVDGNEQGARRQALHERIVDRIREQLREYDVIGQIEPDILAVGLVAYRGQEAQFWTEGLRREIASTPMDIDGRRTTSTISVGVAEATRTDTHTTLIANAMQALQASSAQQNKVTVFS